MNRTRNWVQHHECYALSRNLNRTVYMRIRTWALRY